MSHLLLDVDGTLSDGKIHYTSSGEEMKSFNIKDGLAIGLALKNGICIVIISGRTSAIVERRMTELGVTEIYQGVTDKGEFLNTYLADRKIDPKVVYYIGDDLNDLSAMKICGFKACPSDAAEEVKAVSDYVAKKAGGEGAVREIVEYIFKNSGKWKQVVDLFQ